MGISRINKIYEPRWQKHGLCYRSGYSLWFPDDKEDARYKTPQAKQVCSTPCPVKDKCLQYALETESQYGVWGGTTRSERKAILKELAETGMTPLEWVRENARTGS